MFPVTSKRFASSIHVPRRIIFGGLPYESTPVNVARVPDMEAIERRSTGPTMQIVSSPLSVSLRLMVGERLEAVLSVPQRPILSL